MPEAEYCVLCPDRQRVARRPPVDDACRSWLDHVIGDNLVYAEQIAAPEDLRPDLRTRKADLNTPITPRPDWAIKRIKNRLPAARIGDHRDQLAATAPSGAGMSRLPADFDRIDLALSARQAGRQLHTRGVLGLDEDQVGHLPLATTLETWVRDWAKRRNRGEVGSQYTVRAMLLWLRVRLEWACDEHPEIAAFADEMRSYRSAMMGVLGLIDLPDYKVGVACPSCGHRALYQLNGEWWVRCGQCPQVQSPSEYLEWTMTDAVCSPCIKRIEDHWRYAAAA